MIVLRKSRQKHLI